MANYIVIFETLAVSGELATYDTLADALKRVQEEGASLEPMGIGFDPEDKAQQIRYAVITAPDEEGNYDTLYESPVYWNE